MEKNLARFFVDVFDGTISLIWNPGFQMLCDLRVNDTIISIDYDYRNIDAEYYVHKETASIHTSITRGPVDDYIRWIQKSIETKKIFFSSTFWMSKKIYYLVDAGRVVCQNFRSEGDFPGDNYFVCSDDFENSRVEEVQICDEYEAENYYHEEDYGYCIN